MSKSKASAKKSNDNVEEEKVAIISRTSWGAQPAKSQVTLKTPVTVVAYTDTGTKSCSTKQECTHMVKELQRYHIDMKGLPDIDYSFLIGGDGNVYEGRGWHIETEKSDINSSEPMLEVAFIGTYQEGEIPKEMKEISEKLIKYGIQSELVNYGEGDENNEESNDENTLEKNTNKSK